MSEPEPSAVETPAPALPPKWWGDPDLVMDELFEGRRSVIVMDDTGRPASRALGAEERVGVAIDAPVVPEVCQQLQWLLTDLESSTAGGVLDFHMSRFFSYKCLTHQDRLRYMRALVGLFVRFDLPIVDAELTPQQAAVRERDFGREASGPEGLWLPKDLWLPVALHAELEVLHTAVHACPEDRPVTAWVASGPGRKHRGVFRYELRRKGTDGRRKVHNPFPERLDPQGVVCWVAEDFPPLQLADFAAWSVNRLKRLSVEQAPHLLNDRNRDIARTLLPMVDQCANAWPEWAHRVFAEV